MERKSGIILDGFGFRKCMKMHVQRIATREVLVSFVSARGRVLALQPEKK